MKKRKPKEPVVPSPRLETVRQQIVSALREGTLSAQGLSKRVGVPEKDLVSHLLHIRKSLAQTGERLTTVAARCRRCGFLFKKREKLKKPGKCPLCKAESIEEPAFAIRGGPGPGSQGEDPAGD